MQERSPSATSHRLSLTDRSALILEGVARVESFDREAIVLVTSMGVLEVKGAELHILALDLEGGHCQVEGRIDLLAYRQQAPSRSRGPALRRLLR